ncbi:MAG: NAD(P)-dependent oxidoreductase [Rhodocyclaceae bacterium]|nr:NAD(P)-dependent oxidoreductase [Rhodocyclaceae bacterium]
MTGSVLVTGASGFLGRAVTSQLAAAGWKVYSSVRRDRNRESDFVHDFEDPRFIASLDDLPHLDAIVHLAAQVDFSADKELSLFQSNVVATASLAEFARRRGIHFVFSSSALVAGSKTSNISASSVPKADTAYARSKLLAEELIAASGVHATVLRIGGIFGLNGPLHLGLNRAIRLVLAGSPPEISGAGNSRRNYIYVKDVAGIIADVLSQNVCGTHLVAGSEVLSIGEMLQALCDAFLPGTMPRHIEGSAGFDQLIDPSPKLRCACSFRAALEDMRAEVGR